MLRHEANCSALTGVPDMCTCGALLNAVGLGPSSARSPRPGAEIISFTIHSKVRAAPSHDRWRRRRG